MRRLQAQLQPGAIPLSRPAAPRRDGSTGPKASSSKGASKSAVTKGAPAPSKGAPAPAKSKSAPAPSKGAPTPAKSKSAPAPSKGAPAASKGAVSSKPDDPHRIVAADFVAGAASGGTLPAPIGAEIAFAGRSNVGKSSLINTLVQRRGLVRTGATPGLTRQVNIFEARAADGMVFHFVDLPGYGFARRSKAETAAWATLIEGYLGQRSTLAAVVLIVDARRGLEEDDQQLIDFIDAAELPSRRPVQVILVATKLDKLPRSAHKPTLERLRSLTKRKVFGFSAETGEGREELLRALRRAAFGEPARAAEAEPRVGSGGGPVGPDQNG
ncbi:GTP-binding protein EngB [Minicystis rosea]|nr:GTP-binding protein EngB [Minicystis rosea]